MDLKIIKKLMSPIHLWIGLIPGILFFTICFSGALYTWAPEMERIMYKQKISPVDSPFVPVSTLKATMDRDFPEGDFRTAFYRDKASTAEVLLYGQGTYYIAQINPYTGALIHLQDMNKGWLNYLKLVHRNLLLGDVGQQIVHWSTLLFLVMMLTGIVVWWPNNKEKRRRRFSIKWGASPKKLNYNLHKVLGFYATWISIFSVVTGLFWGFEFVSSGLKDLTGENEIIYQTPASIEQGLNVNANQFYLLDSLAYVYIKKFPSNFIRISNPHKETDPISVVVIDPGRLEYKTNHYYFDRYTGIQLRGKFEYGLHAEASLFHVLHDLVYNIHFGNILGLPGRFLVFFASLIAASLPVTGFIVWFNKRDKGDKKLKDSKRNSY